MMVGTGVAVGVGMVVGIEVAIGVGEFAGTILLAGCGVSVRFVELMGVGAVTSGCPRQEHKEKMARIIRKIENDPFFLIDIIWIPLVI
jgi:hypothetical protein